MVSTSPALAASDPLLNARRDCQGCGGGASVVYEEVSLCGSCFYVASVTSLRRVNRISSTDSAGRVAETATMIASLVQLFRAGFLPGADVRRSLEEDDRHGR